ncbi:callose synthase 3 [Tanacetum coccineum]
MDNSKRGHIRHGQENWTGNKYKVDWKSSKQSTTAMSATVSENIACVRSSQWKQFGLGNLSQAWKVTNDKLNLKYVNCRTIQLQVQYMLMNQEGSERPPDTIKDDSHYVSRSYKTQHMLGLNIPTGIVTQAEGDDVVRTLEFVVVVVVKKKRYLQGLQERSASYPREKHIKSSMLLGKEIFARVDLLRRFYAFEKAQRLDPTSSGRGVRKFKNALILQLERENEPTLMGRVKRSDALEIQSFYRHYQRKYIQAVQTSADKGDWQVAQLTKAYQTASILSEVLTAVNDAEAIEIDYGMLEKDLKVAEKTKTHLPYNILPLDPDSADQAIMRCPEASAVVALRYIRGLPWRREYKRRKQDDVLDWLQMMFGFQKDNVANQREHLILLLANVHVRQTPKPDQQSKILKLKSAGKLLASLKSLIVDDDLSSCANTRLPTVQPELQQPGNTTPMTSEDVKPACGGDEEAFLTQVVSPIYEVISKEVARSKIAKSAHSRWRNYDDLNEYFWSADCFRLGWPMSDTADFFCEPVKLQQDLNKFVRKGDNKPPGKDRWVGKVNFVEIRSFWHVFRSFDRMWSFFILCLQAMIIVAWNGAGNATSIFKYDIFKKVVSVFITASILKLVQAVLDIVLNWKARQCMVFNVKLRYLLKVVSAAIWVVILTITCSCFPLLFNLSLVLYLLPNMLAAVLFLFPFVRRYLETSNHRIVMLIIWWSQPQLYVGREMHESMFSIFKYTTFWILLIITKLAFSYYLEIKPLVSPTKAIMSIHTYSYTWHEFFPKARNNIGAVVALWAPIILVYFMDTQLWYAIFSSLFGGVYGAFHRLGEIQSIGMMQSRFQTLPSAVNACLIPSEKRKKGFESTLSHKFATVASNKEKETARFAQIWNSVITSFRDEDLISNREMDLLLVPYWADRDLGLTQWPLFLLAGKIPIALNIVRDSHGYDLELKRRMENDTYMFCAVRECYMSLRSIIEFLVDGTREKEFINKIFFVVDKHVEEGNLGNKFKMEAFPILYNHFVMLIKCLLTNKQEDRDVVVKIFQDLIEVMIIDVMKDQFPNLHGPILYEGTDQHVQLFEHAGAIMFPTPESEAWKEKINRLNLLLTVRESAMDVPSNLEARRRISFFSNSLFMDMPLAPKVRNMLAFSFSNCLCNSISISDLMPPNFSFGILSLSMPFPFRAGSSSKDVTINMLGSKSSFHKNEDGITNQFYLEKMYPDEFNNFIERMGCEQRYGLERNKEFEYPLRLWASYRGQTLTRTVRGMMYYRKALELQAFLDMAEDEDLMEGSDLTEHDEDLLVQSQVVADMKFTYMNGYDRYPSLRVAYVDEVEERSRNTNNNHKAYYSTLVKAMPSSNSETGQILDQVIYKIKLPGPPMLGEGKQENQNHSIIFTRGEGLQIIDSNQDNYMEEALKMRNLLQEFLIQRDGVRYPTILGVREHIFTESVSSLSHLMCNQETTFVTIGQRLLANPLRVRFHYGHPDVFDRLFHITRGGVSKASKIINQVGDTFAGFNSTLREGSVTHHDYIQVGKGRDAGLNQISLFQANIAGGNGEHTLSRDLYRLGHYFDFFRMLSCYFTTIGFYFSTLITVLIAYVFLYGRLYLVICGLERELSIQPEISNNKSLQVILASQSFMQIGLLMALPMMMEIGLEKGLWTALSEFLIMQMNFAPMFYTFMLGTKTHYYCRTLLHGGAIYRATGRGFVLSHTKFAENYRLYSRSHFVKSIEVMILLLVYQIFGESYKGAVSYILITVSIWFMVIAWLFTPFLFNPSGFEWEKIADDWSDWNKWIRNQGGIGVSPYDSWESWWEHEQEHLRYSEKSGVLVEILLASRFFIYHYVLVYHLSTTKHQKIVLALSRGLSAVFQLIFRLIKGILMFVSIIMIMTALPHMTLQDIIVCILAFMPAGWGLILVAQACSPIVKRIGLWESVRTLARGIPNTYAVQASVQQRFANISYFVLVKEQ